MHIRPFRGLLPASNEAAARIVSPPYDVVSTEEARLILRQNPHSFLQVVRPDAALLDSNSTNIHPTDSCDDIYQIARANLQTLVQTAQLVTATHQTVYVYELAASSQKAPSLLSSNHSNTPSVPQPPHPHVQRGIVALVSVHDYDAGVIKRHEQTRPDKEHDRTRLAEALNAHTGPVFLTYRDVPPIHALVDNIVVPSNQPLFDVSTPPENNDSDHNHVRHRVWPVHDQAAVRSFVDLFHKHVPCSYIADGHHCAAAAARLARQAKQSPSPSSTAPDGRTAKNNDNDNDDASFFLAVLFPASQLSVLPYNRLVYNLNGLNAPDFCRRLRGLGTLTKLHATPTGYPPRHAVHIFVDGTWHIYTLPSAPPSSTTAQGLDCSILQEQILGPLLGVDDPRTSKHIEFVAGVRGLPLLEKRVRAQGSGVAFAMHPVSIEELMQVSDSDDFMPPKSTWFEPKLRSGFFVYCVAED